MSKVTTTKRIGSNQLSSELSGAVISTSGASPESTGEKEVHVDVPETTLQSAIDAHAYDPFWGDDETRQFDAVRAKAQAVLAGTDTFTTAQVQQILARLILYLLRVAGK